MQELNNYVLGGIGTIYSTINFNDILSYLLLILSIINLSYGFILTIYRKVKNKDFDTIPQDIENLKDDLEKLKK